MRKQIAKRIFLPFFSLLFLFTAFLPAQPDSSAPSDLTLDKIFNSREFSSQRFGPVKWLMYRDGYTTLAPSKKVKGGQDLLFFHPRKNRGKILISAKNLIPAGTQKPIKINHYSWSADGKLLLIFTNSKRVWRLNTRGDYWVYNRKSLKLKKLGGDKPASSLMFAKFSPNSRWVGYVHQNNIYIEDIKTDLITQLTGDGSQTIINGTFDWVYEEEFGLRDGFRWSPDRRHIAFWQLDCEGVGQFNLINNTRGLYSEVIPIQYPKVGTTNSACRIGVIQIDQKQTQWFDLSEDHRQNYIARMDWAANSREIIFQHLNRHQNTNRVTIGNIQTGQTQVILTEKDDAWLDVVNNLYWLDKGKFFTWVSERSGWRHIYRVSRNGKKIAAITSGNYDVIRVLKIDRERGWLYFIASPQNPTQRYLYRTALNGKGSPQRLSPSSQKGTHYYNISPNGKWAIHTFSNFDTPPKTQLISLPKHRSQKILLSNQRLLEKIAAIKRAKVEFFKVKDDQKNVYDAWCIKPPHFNPKNKYPLLFFVYGEPAGQTVLDRWSRRNTLWHWMLAQQGYVIMSIDNRGTPAPKGRAWRKSIYKKIGIISSRDQAAAAKAIIAERPYLDPNRIAIWGWSGGGSMSLNMIFRYPDLYKTAMAIAFVADQRYYDTIYQERYMGLPDENPQAFKEGSPITYAHQLKGNLLLVHGTGDDNVHYQNCEALINKLIEHNKHFTMMAYPTRSHGIYEGKNTSLHLFTLLTRYLNNNLPVNL